MQVCNNHQKCVCMQRSLNISCVFKFMCLTDAIEYLIFKVHDMQYAQVDFENKLMIF